jgi:hypothetical protein
MAQTYYLWPSMEVPRLTPALAEPLDACAPTMAAPPDACAHALAAPRRLPSINADISFYALASNDQTPYKQASGSHFLPHILSSSFPHHHHHQHKHHRSNGRRHRLEGRATQTASGRGRFHGRGRSSGRCQSQPPLSSSPSPPLSPKRVAVDLFGFEFTVTIHHGMS